MAEHETNNGDQPAAWLLLQSGSIPDAWISRSRPIHLIPLTPDETNQVLEGGPATATVPTEDEALIRLCAQGLSAPQISRRLHISERTVERRLERLRKRFGVATTPELISLLARLGLGGGEPPGTVGGDPPGGPNQEATGHR